MHRTNKTDQEKELLTTENINACVKTWLMLRRFPGGPQLTWIAKPLKGYLLKDQRLQRNENSPSPEQEPPWSR